MTSTKFQSDLSNLGSPRIPEYIGDPIVDAYPSTTSGSRRIRTIWPSGSMHNLGMSFGPSFVFVQGTDSACLATCDISERNVDSFCSLERIIVALADPRFRFKVPTPEELGDLAHFATVSVVLAPDIVSSVLPDDEFPNKRSRAAIDRLKESSDIFENRATHFLEEKLKNNTAFTCEETIQTAISALQMLYGKNFQADEIKVFVVGGRACFKSLLPAEEVARQLEVINGCLLSEDLLHSNHSFQAPAEEVVLPLEVNMVEKTINCWSVLNPTVGLKDMQTWTCPTFVLHVLVC